MIYKDRMSYYDMDTHTAQLYAPIDEYLKQTKRFSPKAMKKKYIRGIVGISAGALFFLYLLVQNIFEGEITTVLFTLPFVIALLIGLRLFIKNFGAEPHPDMVTCENILDSDTVEKVYKDYSKSREFGRKAVLGREYLFLKGQTIVRLAQITGCDIHEVHDDDSTSYYFRIHVRDELGTRAYDVDYLEGLTDKKRQKKFLELKSILEAGQKRIEQIDI